MPNEFNNRRGVESSAPYVSQREISRNYFAEASEAERRTLIEEQYLGFADFINRQNSLIEMQSVDTSQSDAYSDSDSRDEPQGNAKHSASVDELATMFSNTNFNTSSMVALSTTRADEVLVDIHNAAYGPTNNQPTESRSDTARSVRFQSPIINKTAMKSHKKVVNEAPHPTSCTTGAMTVGGNMNETLLNDRRLLCGAISSTPKPFSSNNPFLQIDDNANAPKADDELMELLSRIDNYVKSRNQGHNGYNGQAERSHNLTQQSGPNYTQPQDRRYGAYAGPADRDCNYARQTVNFPGNAQYSGYAYNPRQNGDPR
uniref:Uncharacterized protein n=1 Tax=Trichogramma kaykai TaxID=54128 RepID=A0ABD2VRF6_9HYME